LPKEEGENSHDVELELEEIPDEDLEEEFDWSEDGAAGNGDNKA
jgi:hypothetical protein